MQTFIFQYLPLQLFTYIGVYVVLVNICRLTKCVYMPYGMENFTDIYTYFINNINPYK